MKVTQEQTAKQYLKKLAKSQEDLVKAKEREINKLNSHYNDKIKTQKLTNDQMIYEQKEMHKVDIAKAIDQKEERLASIRDSLKESATKLQTEKDNLSKISQLQIEDMNLVNEEKFQNLYANAKDKSDEIIQQTDLEVDRLQLKSDEQIKDIGLKAKTRSDEFARDTNKTLHEQQRSYNKQRRHNEKEFRDRLLIQKQDHNDKVHYVEAKNQIEVNQRKQSYQKELQYLDQHHREILKQKDISFKEKFANMEEAHQSILSRVKERLSSEVKGLTEKYGKFKEDVSIKSEDDFYNVTKLNPTIEPMENGYKVQLEVPSYEQETVSLTAEDRNLTLTLTRRFKDTAIDQDGTINKSRRSEVMSKTLNVKDIIDPRSVQRKYEDGVLSFLIAKR